MRGKLAAPGSLYNVFAVSSKFLLYHLPSIHCHSRQLKAANHDVLQVPQT